MAGIFSKIIEVLFRSKGTGEKLEEFSTSMDFDEMEVVLEHLSRTHRDLALEIQSRLYGFRESSRIGDSKKFSLKSAAGYLVLEREDDLAISIYVFTPQPVQSLIDAAYDQAAESLGI